ncbi:MAG: sulfatase-like hydrolase/transferase [Limisphaerales bacterium]
MKIITLLTHLLTASVVTAADKPVHLFILSGQSNMARMNPNAGFMPEAKKLFKDEEVVYIKVSKGSQPICRWLEEWQEIAKENGLDEKHIQRIHKGWKVALYQPILDKYKEMLKKHPRLTSVTFCWMQGESDAQARAEAAYKDALKLLITKLRRDLGRPDMNIVIGRISDYGIDNPESGCVAIRKIQREIVSEDASSAWVDVDDLNNIEVDGKMKNDVHYKRPEGYVVLGERFARQGYALIKGKKTAKNGRPQAESRLDQSDLRVTGSEAKSLKDSKPNIIVIMPDDSGYGNHSCFGNPIIKTPNIDALKKQSLLLTRYHSSARCSPSRAKLLSGRHEFLGGVTDTRFMRERLSLDTITLPQALKTAGYATGFFGKWHNGKEGPYRPENRGFDESWFHESGSRMVANISHNGKKEKMAGTYATDFFFKKATEWMDVQRQAKTPFFVYLPPKSPHGPFKEDSSDMPNEDYKKFLGTHPKMTIKTAKIYWEVEYIDRRIGEMIKQLEEWEIADDTLFIFIGSDNGASGGQEIHNVGMKGHKGQPYQGGTQVPAFFRWPGGGIKGGSESAALISQTDIMPTLLELTGTPMTDQLKKQVEGRSLVPLLKNPATDWEDDRHLVHHVGAWEQGQAAQSKHARVSIQNKRFTLVNNKELYDLKNDPGETKNVIDEHSEIVDQLRTLYDQWWTRMQPRLVNENAYQPPAK